MSWETIWKAVLGVIAGFGGVSGIFVIAIKFSSNFIAEKLSKKYELKLSKELENYKYNLENKNYISKARFDTEFNIYRELSKAFFDMVKDITTMIPIGVATYPADEEKRKEYEDNLYIAEALVLPDFHLLVDEEHYFLIDIDMDLVRKVIEG